MKNLVNWFDIPVKKMDRAVAFYSNVLGLELQVIDMPSGKYAMFPFERGVTSGGLIESPDREPSVTGTLLYLDGGDDLAKPLQRVSPAGGKVIKEKTSLGPNGFMAVFEDTEGNYVALHSMN